MGQGYGCAINRENWTRGTVGVVGPDQGERTRERILDVAYDAINQKGFAATSIEELVEAAGITKSGFFYHFRDKNDMARQLFERFLIEDEAIFDTLESRARALSDDPLQSLLILLNLYAEMMDERDELHPGCMVSTVTYQERIFDAELKRMNVEYLLRMRQRFARWFSEILERRMPLVDTDIEAFADHLTVIVEGAIVQSKALNDPAVLGAQVRLFRNHVKLLFGA